MGIAFATIIAVSRAPCLSLESQDTVSKRKSWDRLQGTDSRGEKPNKHRHREEYLMKTDSLDKQERTDNRWKNKQKQAQRVKREQKRHIGLT